tara:strand:+ start:2675 stop:2911 length:237 start_codon:yes stop_codon:yes gene_type:complete
MTLYKKIHFGSREKLEKYSNENYIVKKHFNKLFINLYYKTYRKFETESFEDCAEIGKYDTVTYFKRHSKKIHFENKDK